MRNYYVLTCLFLILSCQSEKTEIGKFEEGNTFSYKITTEPEGELLADVIPSSSIDLQFEVEKNTGEVSQLKVSKVPNQLVGEIMINNKGFIVDDSALKDFISSEGLTMHQLNYAFVPIPDEELKVGMEWTHTQKLNSAIKLTDMNFEDQFNYKVTKISNEKLTVSMKARVGAMAAVQKKDNVEGTYTINRKDQLPLEGVIQLNFMMGGKIDIRIKRLDDH